MFTLFHPTFNSFSAIWLFLYRCCCRCQLPSFVTLVISADLVGLDPACLYFSSHSCRWLHYTVFSFRISCKRGFIDLSALHYQWIKTLRIKTVFAFCKEANQEISNFFKCKYMLVSKITDFAEGCTCE